jgi:hypothetical protein
MSQYIGWSGLRLAFLGLGGEVPGTGNLLSFGLPGSPVDRIFHGDPHLYQGELIRCQSDHGNHACSRGGVDMSRGDGMDSCTRVPIHRHAWGTCGQVLSCLALNGLATCGSRLSGHLPDA